ncbi:MAG: AmmeMemoRadiSam system protein B [Conexivisphaerales archaeon]
MIRKAVFAGAFYPNDKNELNEMLNAIVVKRDYKENLIGFLVPHAGYIYSGTVAGGAYGLLKDQRKFVILGPNHHGIGGNIITYPEGSWETPLGFAKIDKKELSIAKDYYPFEFEHSIEVQIPFLQHTVKDFVFVPIILKELSLYEYEYMAEIVERLIKEGYFFIVSSDLNHYLSNSKAHEKDKVLLDAFINGSFQEFLEKVYKEDMSACGFMAMAIASIVKEKLGLRFELLDYKTSGDLTGEKDSVVGYASIAFTR